MIATASSLDAVHAEIRALARPLRSSADLDPLLPALQDCPALLLYGQQDRTVPLSHGQRLHAALPNSQLKLLADGHYAVLDQGRRSLVDWITPGELSAP